MEGTAATMFKSDRGKPFQTKISCCTRNGPRIPSRISTCLTQVKWLQIVFASQHSQQILDTLSELTFTSNAFTAQWWCGCKTTAASHDGVPPKAVSRLCWKHFVQFARKRENAYSSSWVNSTKPFPKSRNQRHLHQFSVVDSVGGCGYRKFSGCFIIILSIVSVRMLPVTHLDTLSHSHQTHTHITYRHTDTRCHIYFYCVLVGIFFHPFRSQTHTHTRVTEIYVRFHKSEKIY